jgi:hypothetical protein
VCVYARACNVYLQANINKVTVIVVFIIVVSFAKKERIS